MILYRKCDITTITEGLIGHGVNCQGVMGSGVALSIRKKWPMVFSEYKKLCDVTPDHKLLGDVQLVDVERYLYVINMFTQRFYGNDGRVYADIEAVKKTLKFVIQAASISSLPIHLPMIGCGYGGLSWDNDVRPLVEKYSEEYGWNVIICQL